MLMLSKKKYLEPRTFDRKAEKVQLYNSMWNIYRARLIKVIVILKMSNLQVTSAAKQQLLKMWHLKHRLRILLFRRKIMFHSQDIQVFVFLTIPWFSKSVTSWWVLVHETGCIFEYIFWTTTHEVTKLGQLIDISKDNNFQ